MCPQVRLVIMRQQRPLLQMPYEPSDWEVVCVWQQHSNMSSGMHRHQSRLTKYELKVVEILNGVFELQHVFLLQVIGAQLLAFKRLSEANVVHGHCHTITIQHLP